MALYMFCEQQGHDDLGELYHTYGQASKSPLKDDVGSVAYVPTESGPVEIRCHVYDLTPCSMICESFFMEHLYGKTVPWIFATTLYFPTGEDSEDPEDSSSCILPIAPKGNPGSKLPLGDMGHNGVDIFNIKGLVAVPIIIRDIPYLVQALLVDVIFPHQPKEVDPGRFEMMLGPNFMFQAAGGSGSPIVIAINKLKTIARNPGIFTFSTTLDESFGEDMPPEDDERVLCIYTSGRWEFTGPEPPEAAGIGVFFHEVSVLNVSKPVDARKGMWTPGRAELLAVITALEIAHSLIVAHGCYNVFAEIEIRTDSQYVFEGVNYRIPTWRSDGFGDPADGPIINQDLWIRLIDALDCMQRLSLPTKVELVDKAENKDANELAQIASTKRPGCVLFEFRHFIKADGKTELKVPLGAVDEVAPRECKVTHGNCTFGMPKGFIVAKL